MAASGRAALGLATAAVASAAAFTVWAVTAPVYASGQTLLEANAGAPVRVAVALPLLVTSAAWLLLHIACRFDASRARLAALTPVARS